MYNNELTIVTYHYVRELEKTSYPSIKGLHLSKFKKQLEYFQRVYTFISIQDIFNNLNHDEAIPANALLLTFDDGYTDHFINVFPILNKLGIKGCFFPSAKPVQENKVLSVNKIQFILSSMKNVDDLLKNIYDSLDNNRHLYDLKSNDYYFNLLTRDLYAFDGKKITFIKRILQKELEKKLRESIIDELFKKYVTCDEGSFANELYMGMSEIKYMIDSGMHFGSHGYEHCWFNTISQKEQEKDIDAAIVFLNKLGIDSSIWTMCYPYGGYDYSLIEILKKKKFKFGFTANKGIAKINKNNVFTLKRFDTNDLPITC
jgi:peptidoglycan/xylan/chitin deacetylase (PgdA/CDA1 family)